MTEIEVGEPQPVTPHNQGLYEAGKAMLVDSVSVGREFCKFMVGVSSGAIPVYLALLGLALPKNYQPGWGIGIAAIFPGAVFLGAAATFALGVFPRTDAFSLDMPAEIETARTKAIARRGRYSKWGFVFFSAAALASIIVTIVALRVKVPATPTKPIEVRLIK